MTSKLKRIVTDAGGYGLIILGIALGWLPGPGGIPLILAGLGLLSINNSWASRLRGWVFHHSNRFVKLIFPDHPVAQWAYDVIVIALLAIVAWLAWQHSSFWRISIGATLFFIALLIAGYNRDRLGRRRRKP